MTRFNAQISYASRSHSLCKYLNLAQVNLNSVISQCRIECVQQTLMRFQSHYRFLPFLYLFIPFFTLRTHRFSNKASIARSISACMGFQQFLLEQPWYRKLSYGFYNKAATARNKLYFLYTVQVYSSCKDKENNCTVFPIFLKQISPQ